jgi:hypothetical protein
MPNIFISDIYNVLFFVWHGVNIPLYRIFVLIMGFFVLDFDVVRAGIVC